jgi:hypothetical protein
VIEVAVACRKIITMSTKKSSDNKVTTQ